MVSVCKLERRPSSGGSDRRMTQARIASICRLDSAPSSGGSDASTRLRAKVSACIPESLPSSDGSDARFMLPSTTSARRLERPPSLGGSEQSGVLTMFSVRRLERRSGGVGSHLKSLPTASRMLSSRISSTELKLVPNARLRSFTIAAGTSSNSKTRGRVTTHACPLKRVHSAMYQYDSVLSYLPVPLTCWFLSTSLSPIASLECAGPNPGGCMCKYHQAASRRPRIARGNRGRPAGNRGRACSGNPSFFY